MKSFLVRLGIGAVLLSGSVSQAEGLAMKAGATFGFGYTFGGDTIHTITYTTGETQNLKGGGMYLFKVGGEVRLRDYPVDLQGTVGYHVDNDRASNAVIRYTRWPIEGMAYYRLKKGFRVGAGVRYVTNTKFYYEFEGQRYADLGFNKSVGYVVEGEYFFFNSTSFSLRYVKEPLSIDTPGGTYKARGDHVGILMHIYY